MVRTSICSRKMAALLAISFLLIAGCATEPKSRPIPTTTEKIVQRMAYVVQPGDTLSKIAKGFGVSVSALMLENGKEDTILGIGETLFIPPPSDESSD